MRGFMKEEFAVNTTLKPKEQLFGYLVASGFSPEDAAVRAGYRIKPKAVADRLMQNKDVFDYIRKITENKNVCDAIAGYKRLAFGSVSDAVRLCCGELPDDIETLDLFCVSEIKRTDKGVEVKFFDRIKALDRLAEMNSDNNDSAAPFYRALEEGAKIIGSDCDSRFESCDCNRTDSLTDKNRNFGSTDGDVLNGV